MILSRNSITNLGVITPFCDRTTFNGMTYGLGPHGYDIRIRESLMVPPNGFMLASSLEHFNTLPNDVMGMVKDKSSWARRGICVQNTVIESGWRGYLTLEITNHSRTMVRIPEGSPIAQIIFMWLDEPTDMPYDGKYMDQGPVPTEAISE